MTERNFAPGDILIACDNVLPIPIGYMGHSALVADSQFLVEATDELPFIRKVPISDFLRVHPIHVQFRPVSKELGERVAYCALDYLKTYQENLQQGKNEPVYSVSSSSPLYDPWTGIYCSKLIWLAYYYGAQITFRNDFFLFSPEDLYQNLLERDEFQLIYQHPKFTFKLDT
ncbi:hypothetical protein [Brevibacillus fulvus]|uniref:Permuted papain-like amidase enzyme, YaeF/YiiX, C92 family n=1 Tax=Brevibacillus fulvus TaxID=1125967 RepID=A0A938XZT1_9BACL|nr:hypothetical protein [Brevibacillus fulvus]MBM7589431.1 hypothetical protein [Brevibacillus fulvus]